MDVSWVDSAGAKAVAGTFAGLASIVTIQHIYMQLRYFQNTKLQRLVCRILFMVPIFSIASFLPLVLGEHAFVVSRLKDCYEAFLIYTFLAYIFALLGEESDIVGKIQEGGMDEVPGSRLNILANVLLLGGPGAIAWPLYRSFFPPWEIDGRFLVACKRGTQQFVFIKPILAVLEIVGFYTHTLHHGNLSPKYMYFYVTVIENVIYGTALFYLVLFFTATKSALQSFNPWLKFAVVKGLVFVTFWQGLCIAILVELGLLTSTEHSMEPGEIATEMQCLLTCIEMLGFAIAHRFAFPYNEHTTMQLDTHLHDLGLEKGNGASEEGKDTGILRQGVARGMELINNLITIASVRDLFEDTARNFSLKYHGLTKVSSQSDADDEEPEGLIAVGSDNNMGYEDEDGGGTTYPIS